MPVIKFKHICSASSEDPNNPADNLLSQDTYRKWHCKSPGEKQAVIIIEFEKSSQIHSLDIGNDGSAFVEVLVGRSSLSNDDYQVLLVASSFMSPSESKGWSNTNRVRMFGKDKLSKGTVDQKWDRVKIVCTQPFNKNERYGLAFVKIQSPPEDTAESSDSEELPKTIGIFKLREETKPPTAGSLFYKKEQKTSASEGSGHTSSIAAKARLATTEALKQEDATPKTVSSSIKTPEKPEDKQKIRAESDGKRKAPPMTRNAPPTKKAKVNKDVSKQPALFNELMKGMVLALSGFQNPLRGDLRKKALKMGAQYEADWGPYCTHLVCAFPNTPKYNQVKAQRGLVIKKEWILHCHDQKKRLPAKRYRFAAEHNEDSDDEAEYYDRKEKEIFNKVHFTKIVQDEEEDSVPIAALPVGGIASTAGSSSHCPPHHQAPPTSSSTTKSSEMMATPKEGGGGPEGDDPYGGSTDEEEMETEIISTGRHSAVAVGDTGDTGDGGDGGDGGGMSRDDSEGYDTDDEIERVRIIQKAATRDSKGAAEESNELVKSKVSLPQGYKWSLTDLPNLFTTFKFFIFGDLSADDRRLLVRYITAYNGSVQEYMSESITHVITPNSWDENFDQAIEENSAIQFVHPAWVFACHSVRSCVPCQPFIVSPSWT